MKIKALSSFLIMTIIGFLLSGIIFLAVFEFYAFNEDFYTQNFIALGVHEKIGISESDLALINSELIGYIREGKGDLHLTVEINGVPTKYFNIREQAHLNDIKILVRDARKLRANVLKILALSFVMLLLINFRELKKIFTIIPFVNIFSFIYLVIGALLYLIDFNWAFHKFHEILFYNDLWLLNPYKDRLLQMMPIEFFMIFTLYFMATCLFINLVPLFLYLYLKRKTKKLH